MNPSSTMWKCIITLLTFSIKYCPLFSVGCLRVIPQGHLTAEPAPPLLMGSNVTVYCHITKIQRKWFDISLELNGETVDSWRRVNGTAMIFSLPSVWKPWSTVLCKCKMDQLSHIVAGLDLRPGLPPDKPGNITCETTRSSEAIHCFWKRGKETFCPTSYRISINRENGTQIHSDQIQDVEEITIPKAMLDENTKYLLNITAHNHFGVSQSDPFTLCIKDTVIPETPHIIQVEFRSDSSAAMLHWKTAESSADLRSCIRLHTDHIFWAVREGTELSDGLIQVDNLRPLTEYEFQMRTCRSALGLTHTSKKVLCSKWSSSVRKSSPGKGPSQQLDVWRTFVSQGTKGMQTVTVLWKPLPLEDYSGQVLHYKIFWAKDQKHEVFCGAPATQCSVQVPAEVQTLSVAAVASYGTSPPAEVTLRHSDVLGPVLRDVAPAANGNGVLVSWSWAGDKHRSTPGELLYYVIEWKSVPAGGLLWQKLTKDLTNTSITGLTAGVRYTVTLHAVTTRGVSGPSSKLVYSGEKTPVSGPNMSVLVHEARRILIQWDELPVDQQKGFITKYTIYFLKLDSSNTEHSVTVSGSGPRQIWLDCPEGALTLQMTASTAAGEGVRGRQISSQPASTAVDLVIVTVFVITIFVAIMANLMCWRCVRKRIKQQCISWGPTWLVEKLPKPGHSNAIRLLKDDASEPLSSSIHGDPPLSPIIVISQGERDEVYPAIHIEASQTGLGQPTAETDLMTSHTWTALVDSQMEESGYKPQTAALASHEEEKDAEERQSDIPVNCEENGCLFVFDGLLGGFLSSADVDFSDSPQGLSLGSLTGHLRPNNSETIFLNRGIIQGRSETEESLETDSPSVDLQQDDTMTPGTADTISSQCTDETTLNGGYFPQIAAVSSTAP